MRTRSPLALAIALLAAALRVGAACGGSEDSNAPGPSASASGAGASACASDAGEEPPFDSPPIHTPRWAFEPWISKAISDGADTYAFVKGFEDRDIPVGAVVLDSPWETNYNTFVPNPSRYPNFGKMVSDLNARGVRVVVWITAFVNAS